MSDTFTDVELITISLVLGQNADQYDDLETKRRISRISTKAREAVDNNDG